LLAPHSTHKVEDHHLLAVRECIFNIFADTIYISRLAPLSTAWGHVLHNRQSARHSNITTEEWITQLHMFTWGRQASHQGV